jgi:PucR family transcriptional regulator, purine catabolism regulatory protein
LNKVSGLQIRDLLEIELLKAAGVTVVSGEELLDRQVRWVHTGEIVDIAHFLTGGEVLLTAATGLTRSSEGERRRYIRELADVGVAGLIIELGRSFNQIPEEMVEEARRGGLVLVSLACEVPFVAVTQRAHTMLVSSAHMMVQRALEIDDALNSLMLEGAPMTSVLELLAEMLGNPVVFEDGNRRAIAHGGPSGSVSPLLSHWQGHSRQGHRSEGAAAVSRAEGAQSCMWSVVTVRGEPWGRLHVVEVDSPLDDLARLALSRATASIALYLMSDRDAVLSDTAEHSLIGGLTASERFSGREFLARARGLGVDLDGDLCVLIFGPRTGAALDADEIKAGIDEIRRAFRASGWPAVVGSTNNAVAAVARADPPAGLDQAILGLIGSIPRLPFTDLQLGVSRSCRASQLPQAQSEAIAAVRLGPLSGTGVVHFYDNLVLYRLLTPLASGPGLANFVEEELGPLLSADDQQHAELLHSLDAYLQANGNKIATAQALFLQRRSVYYRLERIEELLGKSLDDPDTRARLYIALRAHELLEARVT